MFAVKQVLTLKKISKFDKKKQTNKQILIFKKYK